MDHGKKKGKGKSVRKWDNKHDQKQKKYCKWCMWMNERMLGKKKTKSAMTRTKKAEMPMMKIIQVIFPVSSIYIAARKLLP